MRDHNVEYQDNVERRYAYTFDSIVRGYMMRALEPFFGEGNALELGCYDGESTSVFAERFADLTVVEAASELISRAKERVPRRVAFIHSTIESAELPPVYDSIFLIHTLEHLDDPVGALSRIRGWLSPKGRLFVVVPNANAASRQLAVKMGLIPDNHAITEGEKAHGHRCTYSLDTLERDVRASGLMVEARGGIFFKPFANFQFDRLMESGIIDQGYLDACYALGMQYPQLTASVYNVCRNR